MQVSGDSQVYDAPFTDRRVVGVLWSTKVDSFTYFGDNLAFVHGIQVCTGKRSVLECAALL